MKEEARKIIPSARKSQLPGIKPAAKAQTELEKGKVNEEGSGSDSEEFSTPKQTPTSSTLEREEILQEVVVAATPKAPVLTGIKPPGKPLSPKSPDGNTTAPHATPERSSRSEDKEGARERSASSMHLMSKRESTMKKTQASRDKVLAFNGKTEQTGTAKRKLALIEEEIRPCRDQEKEDEPVEFAPTWHDLKCLRSSGRDSWLSDVVIYAYLKRISDGTRICVIDPLVSSVNYHWPATRRGLPRSQRELEGVSEFLIPLLVNGNHWTIATYNKNQHSACFFDPKHNPRGAAATGIIERVTALLHDSSSPAEVSDAPDDAHPLQTDSESCGPRICILGKLFIEQRSLSFTEAEVEAFREEMLASLDPGGLLEMEAGRMAPPREPIVTRRPDAQKEAQPVEKDRADSSTTTALQSNNLKTAVPDTRGNRKKREKPKKLLDLKLIPPKPTTAPARAPKKAETAPVRPKGLEITEWVVNAVQTFEEGCNPWAVFETIADRFSKLVHLKANGNLKEVDVLMAQPILPMPSLAVETDNDKACQVRPPKKEKEEKFRQIREKDPALSASELQRLYKQNRKMATAAILGDESKQCKVEAGRVEEYFRKVSSAPKLDQEKMKEMRGAIPKLNIDSNSFLASFTPQEAWDFVKKAKVTAPGPDRITYKDLREADPGGWALAAICNTCRRHGKIPHAWKQSETILLHKKGDENDLDNWRPISMMSVVYKVYTSLWARRLSKIRGLLSKEQKGFTMREGCAENLMVMKAAIQYAKGRKTDLAIALLDLANAFGSVPHELIRDALEAFGLPEHFVGIIKDMYTHSTMVVKTATEKTDPIPIRAGVKQGDPISPILFNVALEYLIRNHKRSFKGAEVYEHPLSVLAFADDMAIVAPDSSSLDEQLARLSENARALNLVFKPKKCASLSFRKGQVESVKVKVNGAAIPAMSEDETYKYLGIHVGARAMRDYSSQILKLMQDMKKIKESLLAPWQKLETIKQCMIPQFNYIVQHGDPKTEDLQELDRAQFHLVKEIHSLPITGTPLPYLLSRVESGGLGLESVEDAMHLHAIDSVLRFLNSDDIFIRTFFNHQLYDCVEKFRGKDEEVDVDAVRSFLNDGRSTKNFSLPRDNLFNKFRRAIRHWKKVFHRFEVEFDGTGDYGLIVQTREGQRCLELGPLDAKKVYTKLRLALTDFYQFKLKTEYKAMGRVIGNTAIHKANNEFVRDGGFVSFSAHRWLHRARLDLHSLNGGARSKHKGRDPWCRRCGYETESLAHVLGHCKFQLGTNVTKRHNALQNRVVEAIRGQKRPLGSIAVEVNKVCDVAGRSLRPDLIVKDETNHVVTIVDFACPFENGAGAMEKRVEEKRAKYEPERLAFERQGYKATCGAIVVGALGTWHPQNDLVIRQLGIPASYSRKMIKFILAETLEYSKNIFWRHILGDRFKPRPYLNIQFS